MASLNPSSDISAFMGTVFDGVLLVARDNNFMPSVVRGSLTAPGWQSVRTRSTAALR